MSDLLDLLTDVNDRINAQVRYQAEQPGQDHYQTPKETRERGTGDCEDIAIAKYWELHKQGLHPQLMYCLWDNPKRSEWVDIPNDRDKRRMLKSSREAHMVCLQGNLVLDNIISEIRTVEERQDLTPVYVIGHKGLRAWNSNRWMPTGQHSKFKDLIERIQRGE